MKWLIIFLNFVLKNNLWNTVILGVIWSSVLRTPGKGTASTGSLYAINIFCKIIFFYRTFIRIFIT
jgi:hypothetical protein